MVKYVILIILCLAGFLDASYLSYEHFMDKIPPCSVGAFSDCGTVLRSQYAVIGGVPLALIGVVHYSLFFVVAAWTLISKKRTGRYVLVVQSIAGFCASLYFVYLQLVVLRAICLYCMVSAITSTVIFIWVMRSFADERKRLALFVFGWIYTRIVKPLFFSFDPETVHVFMMRFGERWGSLGVVKVIVRFLFHKRFEALEQKIAGINFPLPVGLAAGFDYEARLTQTLSAWGFGFQSIGSITNKAYEGNTRPMLGRLPKSRSLMVNKGFKNDGAEAVVSKLENYSFGTPVGVSIGRTNSREMVTQKESIEDIISCFKKFESSSMAHSYYELNISCPNLHGPVSFYPPDNLEELLVAVDALLIQRPVFVKMPIEKSNEEIMQLLDVIVRHKINGVIFGNLQKDRNHPSLDPEEVAKFDKGGFSGKPTYDRSNELISLTYAHFKDRLVIIGCGGIFSAEDAYEKIQRGAGLIQLITGMIYEGPQLVASINFSLVDLLHRDGFNHISEAVGTKKGV